MIDRRKIDTLYPKYSKKIKNFLLSKMSKEFLIFLLFFFIASAFWLLQTLNDDYETEFSMPIRMRGVPNDIVITSETASELKVRVKDKGIVLLNYIITKNFYPINLEFPNDYEANDYIKIYAKDFEKKITSQLNASTRLLTIKPDTLEYIYSTGMAKLIPIKLQGKISSGRQYYIPDTLYNPDSVLVYAPASLSDSISYAYTEKIVLENISDTTTYQAQILPVKGVKFIPNTVNITFPTDVYTEKIVEVPLRGINFPADKILRTFPSKVKVTFQVGMSRFKDIDADDFNIHIPYEELININSDKYEIKLANTPAGISNIRISPKQIDFLIEQTTTYAD